MKLKINDKINIKICYCDLCKNSGGRIDIIDDETNTIYLRSGKWLLEKVREENKEILKDLEKINNNK